RCRVVISLFPVPFSFFFIRQHPLPSTLFPYTTLFRSMPRITDTSITAPAAVNHGWPAVASPPYSEGESPPARGASMTDPSNPHDPAPTAQYPPRTPPGNRGLRLGLGLGLLVLPLAALVVAYLLPTLRTIELSFQSGNPFSDEPASTDPENYSEIAGDVDFLQGFVSVSSLALGLVIAGAVIAPLVAWCLHSAGSGVRMAARIV